MLSSRHIRSRQYADERQSLNTSSAWPPGTAAAPTTINGVEVVCTGVGSAKDDPRWSAYPVKIVLATTGGAIPEVSGPDGDTCIAVAPGDAEALAAGIRRALTVS